MSNVGKCTLILNMQELASVAAILSAYVDQQENKDEINEVEQPVVEAVRRVLGECRPGNVYEGEDVDIDALIDDLAHRHKQTNGERPVPKNTFSIVQGGKSDDEEGNE